MSGKITVETQISGPIKVERLSQDSAPIALVSGGVSAPQWVLDKINDLQAKGELSATAIAELADTLTGKVDRQGFQAYLPPQIDVFTEPGNFTWVKPSGAKLVEVIVIGAGGGGGSGRVGAPGTVRCGGGGGAGGQRSRQLINAAALADSCPIKVGRGQSGGASVTADNSNGNSGESAMYTTGQSMFYYGVGATGPAQQVVRGDGGNPGSGGRANGGQGGNQALATSEGPCSTGGSASTAGETGGNAVTIGVTPSGGGAGGGITNGNAVSAGGSGGQIACADHNIGATGGSSNGDQPPGLLNRAVEDFRSGRGNGGGGSSTTKSAASGGNGMSPGGGGGGGGAAENGFSSGAGGSGGDGRVIVITYF